MRRLTARRVNMKIWHKWEREQSIKRVTFFFRGDFFFGQKQRDYDKRNKIFSKKKEWKQRKIAKCFWISCMKETNSKAKIDETQEKQEFKKMIKRVSMIFFETFVQKQNDIFFKRSKKKFDRRKSRIVMSRSAHYE